MFFIDPKNTATNNLSFHKDDLNTDKHKLYRDMFHDIIINGQGLIISLFAAILNISTKNKSHLVIYRTELIKYIQ